MTTYEYDVTEKPQSGYHHGDDPVPGKWRDHLNERAAEGWELDRDIGPYFIWKRPRRTD